MKTLILGGGGREHAVAQAILKSEKCKKVFILPGNAGTEKIGENVAGDINDFEHIKNVVLSNEISVVFVGPEDPIVKGIYDFFKKDKALSNVIVIAPGKSAARLEGSKDFAKKFMKKYKIPTAKHSTFSKDNIKRGYRFLEEMRPHLCFKSRWTCCGKRGINCK